MAWILVLLPVFYALYVGALWLIQDRMVFPADMAGPVSGAFRGPAQYERWPIDLGADARPPRDGSAHREVEAWFFPAPGNDTGGASLQPGPAVIHFHGNAELIDHQEHIVMGYHRLGVSVLLAEYRGYGRSAGNPTQQYVVEDAVAWVDRLLADPRVDAERFAIHGRSIGASVAQQVAAQRTPQALVLETATSHIAPMAWRFGIPPAVMRHPFDGRAVLRTTPAYVLVFQAQNDPIFPPKHGRKILELAGDRAKLVTYDTDHVAFPGDANWKAYWVEIEQALADAGVLPDDAAASAPESGPESARAAR
ncbi:MAG: alpha/beta hydrolase [Planctomycetota bacterium]